MKELSIEDKAKRYDEALQRTRKWWDSNTNEGFRGIFEEIFPELKESEDERILKQLRDFFKNHINSVYEEIDDNNDVLAWLEKQGEQSNWKPSKEEMDALYGLAYITNKMDDKKDEAITKLYQDLKREFFSGVSYENMFPSSPVDAPIKLEKQGEQKPVIEMKTPEESLGIDSDTYNKIVDECIYGEQKPTDKVEQKFHKGDWVVCEVTGSVYQIKNCIENLSNRRYGYDLTNGGYIGSNKVNHYHLWTIQDAKPGDVLCTKNKCCPFIYDKGRYNNGLAYYYAGIDVSGDLNIKSPHNMLAHFGRLDNICPATKEQRDLLFQKMKESGYEWDADKKELRKIEHNPAWSEEDDQYLLVCKNALAKYQVSDKWDATIISRWLEDKLKSLRPQSHWKPSDEQLNNILDVLSFDNCTPKRRELLESLYHDLKKLKA